MAYQIPKIIEPSNAEIVEDQIRRHPGIMTRHIVDALGMTGPSVNMIVHRLQAGGKIHRVNPKTERRAQWEIGPDPEFDPDANSEAGLGLPRQITTSEWKVPDMAPQTWLSALEWQPD